MYIAVYNPSNSFARKQFVLAHHVTEYPPAKTEGISESGANHLVVIGSCRVIFPNLISKDLACCKTYLKDNKRNSLHLAQRDGHMEAVLACVKLT